MTILESKWPEKVKQNFIWLYLASEWSKTLSEMGLFNEIALHVWFHFENSGAISKVKMYFFFSGHLDIEKPIEVKNFEVWYKMRQWRGGRGPMFWFSQKKVMDN